MISHPTLTKQPLVEILSRKINKLPPPPPPPPTPTLYFIQQVVFIAQYRVQHRNYFRFSYFGTYFIWRVKQ